MPLHFVFFAPRYHSSIAIRSTGLQSFAMARTFWSGCPSSYWNGDNRFSQVPVYPFGLFAHVPATPVGLLILTNSYQQRGPNWGYGRDAYHEISELNSMAFRIAVYTSQDGLLHHQARLASNCWLSSIRWGSHPLGDKERFPLAESFCLLPPSTGLLGANP